MSRGVLLILLTSALAGCPDAGQDPPGGGDGGGDGGEGGVAWDSGALPDLGPITACQASCLARAPHLCLEDPAVPSGPCVECLTDSHCQGNPGALGPRCDSASRSCTCKSDTDCVANARGRRCHDKAHICTCLGDGDCGPAFPLCGGLGLARTCVRPCTGHASCADPAALRCDRASGRCVACVADSDCAARPNGGRCKAGRCVCEAEADCWSTAYPWGAACGVVVAQGKRCGCFTDAQCKGNPHGPTCDTARRRCTCASDSDCGARDYPLCYLAYGGAKYAHCQAACTSDSQCARELGLSRCHEGKCK